MGLFDRFKKKQEPKQQTIQMPQSILLDYGENGTADLKFMGLIDIDGKILSNVVVTYIDEKKEFKQGSFLLEPNMVQDQKGNWIDGTEQYYSNMAIQNPNAMKNFFAKDAIMDDAQGSNYIGGLQVAEDGSWSRNYDVNLREKYRQQANRLREQKNQVAHEKHIYEEQKTADYVKEQQEIGIQQQLQAKTYKEDESGYATRLTQEDYQKFFGHRENKTVDNNGVR